MRRLGLLVLVVLLAVQPVGAAIASAPTLDSGSRATSGQAVDAVSAQTGSTIVRTMTFSLTPDRPGEVDVRMSFSIPDNVEELQTGIPQDVTVRSTDGFRRTGPLNYSWNERTADPSITFSLPVNETGAYHYDPDPTAAEDPSSGLTFVDTGPWAIVSVPSAPASWTYRGLPAPTFEGRIRTAGEGVAGSRIVFLGPNSATTRTIDGQQITLVNPDHSDLEADPDSIFALLGEASRSLPVGAKPERSVFIAAPTTVEWGPYGVTEDSDVWVRANQGLDDPNNVWIHEYVHVRQSFRTTTDARWIFEAMAEYYAASLSLQQGYIGFEEFSEHLDRGTADRYDRTVLAEPATWGSLGNYVRGALVFGEVDRRMRLATDSRHPASHLLRELNQHKEPVDHAYIHQQIGSLAGTDTARAFDRYATTDRAPEMWSRSAHRAAFSTLPAVMTTTVESNVTLSGPYRDVRTGSVPTIVPGERLTFNLTVENEGDADGSYESALRVDGTAVSNTNGTLSGGANQTQTLSYTFQETGSFTVEIEDTGWNVTVREPAQPVVTGIDGPSEPVEQGEPVAIGVSVANRADRPAEASLAISADGSTVETWTPQLDVSETADRTVQLSFDTPGTHEIRVGDERLSVSVTGQTTTAQATSTATRTGTTTPGFGIIASGLALLVSLALWVRYRAF